MWKNYIYLNSIREQCQPIRMAEMPVVKPSGGANGDAWNGLDGMPKLPVAM
jgi:hypothetical protein